MTRSLITITLGLASLLAFADEDYDYDKWNNRPHEKFSQGAQMFQKAKEILQKEYYKEGVSEEELYRAAVQGMVQHLDPTMEKWNRLISPTELKELKIDMKGEIVGSGLEITLRDALVDILSIIPSSPAEKAGIKTGDKLLAINGTLCKGKQLRDIIYQIRGKIGESRKLTLLRDDKVITKTLHLGVIPYANVTSDVLPGNIALVGIRYFSEATAKSLRAALEKARDARVAGIIVDLRENGGGLFDRAIESAGFLLSRGKTIVGVSHRGAPDEKVVAQGDPILSGIPMAVLINENTFSGAEVVAAALKESGGAKLVGNRTNGKWSVQKIEELGNSFALKFTTGFLKSPAGHSFNGTGVQPDIIVTMGGDKAIHRKPLLERLDGDPQLKTALNLLKST